MKPRVAVSSCLLGNPVRYDGGHKAQHWMLEELPGIVELIPLCPEVEAGLGVPRPPVRLVQTDNGIRALGVDDEELDVTDRLNRYAEGVVGELSGFNGLILKARSPSCGYLNSPLYDSRGNQIRLASGLFAEYIERTLPDIPVIDEEGIQDAATRKIFLDRVFGR